jgi:proline iminopeptidase
MERSDREGFAASGHLDLLSFFVFAGTAFATPWAELNHGVPMRTLTTASVAGILSTLIGCSEIINSSSDSPALTDSGDNESPDTDTGPGSDTDTALENQADILPGEPWTGGATEWTFSRGGVSHYARSVGAGNEVLVVVNGGPGQSHDYCESADVLATTQFKVVTYDQRGTGQTAHPQNGDYSLDAYVADLEALRKDLGVEKMHLLGHSFGGVFAMAYVAAHPDRVASLQLFSSSPVTAWDLDSAEFERRIASFEADGTFEEGYNEIEGSNDCAPYFQTIWPVYLHDADFPMTSTLRSTTCDLETFFGTSDSNMFGWDFTQDVRKFSAPTAVYYGEADPFILESQSIAQHFQGTQVKEVEVAKCGHYWEECAGDFFEQAAGFLGAAL